MYRRLIFLLLVATLLSRCATPASQETIIPSEILPTTRPPLSTKVSPNPITDKPPLSTLAPQPTPTVMNPEPSVTHMVISSPTAPLNFQLSNQCLELIDKFPIGVPMSGTLVYTQQNDQFITDILFLDLSTNEIKRIVPEPKEVFYNGFTSPKGRWLLYERLTYAQVYRGPQEPVNDELIITTADRQTQFIIPFAETWHGVEGWLDEEHLLISTKGDQLDSLIILNPFTGEQQEWVSDYPNIFYLPEVSWWNFSQILAAYDPTFTRVVYPVIEEPGWEIVLWDIPSSKRLALIFGKVRFGPTPRWAPDGGKVILPIDPTRSGEGYNELASISREGDIAQLTNLAAFYPRPWVGESAWSPDGRYIAFWLIGNPSDPEVLGEELVVYDTNSRTAVNYCIRGGTRSAPPFWLPNSHQLIISNPWEGGIYHTILVDIVSGYAIDLGDHMHAYGWMESTP